MSPPPQWECPRRDDLARPSGQFSPSGEHLTDLPTLPETWPWPPGLTLSWSSSHCARRPCAGPSCSGSSLSLSLLFETPLPLPSLPHSSTPLRPHVDKWPPHPITRPRSWGQLPLHLFSSPLAPQARTTPSLCRSCLRPHWSPQGLGTCCCLHNTLPPRPSFFPGCHRRREGFLRLLNESSPQPLFL